MMTKLDLQFIESTTLGLQRYVLLRRKEDYDADLFEDMICHIMEVLSKWTGQTWVGCKKEKKIEVVFQRFFVALNDLVVYIDLFKEIMSDVEKEFVSLVVYSGVIHRYLGSGIPCNKECVEIQYNDIYVSWSKNERNIYIESKLYGPYLCIKAHTLPDDYAIDIEGIEKFYQNITGKKSYIVKGEEREVVYPTKQDSVLEVRKMR